LAKVLACCRASPPELAIVLGSGLGPVAGRLATTHVLDFQAVPGLVRPTVAGHAGLLRLGDWVGRRVLLFEGRLHRYEGHPWETVIRPAETAAQLGASVLLVTSAVGGIHEELTPGRLMAVSDHIDWTWPYPWRRPGPGGIAPPRPSPYSGRLLELLGRAAAARGLALHQGTYAAVTGPCYETPAEIRALRSLGADAVGMSTAREVEAAAARGLQCAALGCVTNRAAGLAPGPIQHGQVLTLTAALCGQVADLIETWLTYLHP
jgi:purine-nucleoside phosphorylase